MRRLLTAVVILMWSALLVGGGVRTFGHGQARPDPQPGRPAPELRGAVDLNGQAVSLRDLKGKAVLLNFWASWCPPCRAEMPAIDQLARHLPPDTAVVTVNLTSQETSQAAVRAFLQAAGYAFPVALDPQGQVGADYAIAALPTSLFISPGGVITARITAPLDENVMLDYLKAAGR